MNHAPFYLFIPNDEVPFSTIARFALIGAYRAPQAMEEIYGNPKKRVHPYLPGKIQRFADFFELPVEEAIRNKTMFPLLTFSQPSDSNCILKAMRYRADDKVLLRTAIGHSRFKTFYGLNFCPVCVQKDIENIGFAYWHIKHQIPGIRACNEHGSLLVGVPMGDGYRDRSLFLPPFEQCEHLAASATEIKFSEFSVHLLELCKTHQLSYQNIYRHLLEKRGLTSPNGGYVEISKVMSMLSEYWADITYTDHLEPGVPFTLKGFNYIGRILRKKTHSHAHPIKHILLACWLADGNIKNLIVEPFNSLAKVEKEHIPDAIDNEQVANLIIELLKDGVSLNAIEEKTGKSRCYIQRVAGTNRIAHSSNSMAFSDDIKRKALIKALYGIHREIIAKQLGLSVGYVEQVICCEPKMSEWRKHMRIRSSVMAAYRELESIRIAHPNWCRTEIRKQAQSAYFILYYNDKSLIDKVMPKKIKPAAPLKDWDIEDERILKNMKDLSNLPLRSLTEIGRLVNDRGYLRRKITQLPKCERFLIRAGVLNI
tara:strand:- start:1397 stop:3013 length:1617 start_codon:yes stop_codon:yes gene_type:complete